MTAPPSSKGSRFERWSLQASLSSVITQAPCPCWNTPEQPGPSRHPVLPSLRYPIPKPGPHTALPRGRARVLLSTFLTLCVFRCFCLREDSVFLWGRFTSQKGNHQCLQSQRGETVGTEKEWCRVGVAGIRPLEPGVRP